MVEKTLSKEDILKIVDTIRASDAKDKERHFKSVFKTFSSKYPVLYANACKDSFDIKTFTFLLDMMDMVQKQETTQHDASVAVGQELFSKFVDISKLKASDTPVTGGPKISFTQTPTP